MYKSGSKLAHDARPVMPLAHAGDAPFPRPALETMLLDGDLENAQELAWHTAQAHGLAFPAPEDLPPLQDGTVRYAVVIRAVDPATSALAVEKSWSLPRGEPGIDRLTLATFASDDEAARAQAEADLTGLLETYDARGLEGMMHQVELAAMRAGGLDPDRADARLFRHGPPDRFETLAERLRDEPNPYWHTDDEVPPPAPGSWDELVERQTTEAPQGEPHPWTLHTRPVETPKGTSSGSTSAWAV